MRPTRPTRFTRHSRPARRSALVVALAAALAFSLPAGPAAGFMRPSLRPAIVRIEGKYLCRSPGGLWDVRLETNGAGVISGELVARETSTSLETLGLLRDGRLMLAIGTSTGGGGIVVYRLGDGRARGEFTTFSSREFLGEELLDGGPSGGPPGTYTWIARNPSPTPLPLGSGGSGTLAITEASEVFSLDWHNGVTGFGLRQGPNLAVSWGSSGPHEIVVLAPAPDGWRGVIAGAAADKPLEISLVR